MHQNIIPFKISHFSNPLMFLLLITGSIGCSYSAKTSQKLYNQASLKTYDLIVVPGAPITEEGLNKTLKGRIYWSKFLYDKGIAKNIMYSGSAVYNPVVEASAMAAYARAIGVPAGHVFEETKAEHSTENIYYSAKKARQLGFKTIALASDPFQTRMLKKFARKRIGPDIGLIPFVTDSLKALEPTITDPVIDLTPYRNPNFIPLKQREGFWKRLRGTMGLNMDRKAYE